MMNPLRSDKALWAFLVILTLVRLTLSASLPLTPDEAYYWIWSRHLQGGYLDHPPMVALWIRLGTTLFGATPFGVRVIGPLAALCGSVMLWRSAIGFGLDPQGRRLAVLSLNATLMIGLGAATMTPDTPLMFFVAASLLAAGMLLESAHGAWWLLLGASLGLACESKYTAFLPALACFIWWLMPGPQRRPLWAIAGGLTGLVILLPNLLWNSHHDWASIAKQGGRTHDWHSGRALQFMGELLSGQIALATPLIFALFVLSLAVLGRQTRRDSAARLIVLASGVPILVFTQHALGDRVQANWPAVFYPTMALAIGRAMSRARLVRPALFVGYGMTMLLYVQALFHPLPLSSHLDVIARETSGWPQYASSVEAALRPDEFVATDDYAVAAELAFAGDNLTVAGIGPRWNLLSLRRERRDHGLFVTRHGSTHVDIPSGWRLGARRATVCRLDRSCSDLDELVPDGSASNPPFAIP